MPYYKICQDCGASLDPDEICDCQKERWYVEGTLINGNSLLIETNGKPYNILKHFEDQIESIKLIKLS